MRRKIVLVVVSVLFLGAIIGVVNGFNVPTEKEKLVTNLTYKIDSEFAHLAYEKFVPEAKPSPRYFARIIESITVDYSYKFLTAEPVTGVTSEVTISASVESRGNWQKEVTLVPRLKKTGDFTSSFPLYTAPLQILADNISQEVGVGGTIDIVLTANVHTVAETGRGMVEDDFVQTSRMSLTSTTLTWDKELSLSELGYGAGLKYEHQGNFGYTIQLKPNILSGTVTIEPVVISPAEGITSDNVTSDNITSENVTGENISAIIELRPIIVPGSAIIKSQLPPSGAPVVLPADKTYKRETIDHIDGTFSFKLESSETLSNVVNEVEITAEVSGAGGGQETFILVPRKQETGDLEVTFLLDIPFFYAVIQSTEPETGAAASSHQLTVTAAVHTTAESEFGPIDETLSQQLVVELGPKQVNWPEVTPQTKEGALTETLVIPNTGAKTAKIGSLGALVMTAVILLYAIWSYWEFKHKWISRMEADARMVRDKRPDLVVDVENLPDIESEGTVIGLASLDELIKTADALLKPVLRLTEPERHTYCVIDGLTRYQYESLPQYISPSET
ncbi:MAG: hypothetical protein HYU85_00235 [Chloroflexi bacterium]|nr:hypothetical protein [Chloroflexota bacterium]